MKKKNWPLRIALLAIAALLVMALAKPLKRLWEDIHSFPTASVEDLQGYVKVIENAIPQLSEKMKNTDQISSKEVVQALQNLYQMTPALTHIQRHGDGRMELFFTWSRSAERFASLSYCPQGLDNLNEQWLEPFSLPRQSEELIRREGLGINGAGYIQITCILENWYLVETYLPT